MLSVEKCKFDTWTVLGVDSFLPVRECFHLMCRDYDLKVLHLSIDHISCIAKAIRHEPD